MQFLLFYEIFEFEEYSQSTHTHTYAHSFRKSKGSYHKCFLNNNTVKITMIYNQAGHTHTHTHTQRHIYIYIYILVIQQTSPYKIRKITNK